MKNLSIWLFHYLRERRLNIDNQELFIKFDDNLYLATDIKYSDVKLRQYNNYYDQEIKIETNNSHNFRKIYVSIKKELINDKYQINHVTQYKQFEWLLNNKLELVILKD